MSVSEGIGGQLIGGNVGLARRSPSSNGALGAAPAAVRDLVDVAFAFGSPHGFDTKSDAHLVGRQLEDVLQAERAPAVEREGRLGERLSLCLPVVLHRR